MPVIKGTPLNRKRPKTFSFDLNDQLPVTKERLEDGQSQPKALLYYASAYRKRKHDFVVKIFSNSKYYNAEKKVMEDIAEKCGSFTMATWVNDAHLVIILPRMDMDLVDWYGKYIEKAEKPCVYLRDIRDMYVHLLKTLQCLHKNGIYYLDMKLDNVLVNVDDKGHIKNVVLIDFDGSVMAQKDRPRSPGEGLSTYPYPTEYQKSLVAIDLWNLGYMFLLFWVDSESYLEKLFMGAKSMSDLRIRIRHVTEKVQEFLSKCLRSKEGGGIGTRKSKKDIELIESLGPFLEKVFSCTKTQCGPEAKLSSVQSLLKSRFLTLN